MFAHDDIFDKPRPMLDFRFDEKVVAVFADMIHRSIPAYAAMLQLIGVQGGSCVPEGGVVYDLGCSLGGASFALQRFIPPSASIHALDLSEAMIERLQEYVSQEGVDNIYPAVADVMSVALQPCDLVVMNFTLQFIAPQWREAVLAKIYQALKPNGVLLLGQKVLAEDERVRLWHEAFKASQGYSQMAIAQKRESLESVMQTDSFAVEEARLHQVGFVDCYHYFRALSFNGWVAYK